MPIAMDLGFGEGGSAGSINRLANKHTGTQGLPRFRPRRGLYSCLSALGIIEGIESYRGAQMQSGEIVETRVVIVLLAAPS